jgi:hypothetical protein
MKASVTRSVHNNVGNSEHHGRWFGHHEGLMRDCGGNSLFRTGERIAAEKRYLATKWKAHIRLETYKSQDRVAMDAPRRQSVKL